MANLLETVKEVFKKAGLTETNELVATLLQSEEVKALAGLELAPVISNLLAQKLINIEGAKAHSDVSAHYKKSYFGAIDNVLKASLQELGIPDETIIDLEKNPTDKRVSEALKRAVEIKGKSTNNQEIETLRNTLQSFKDTTKAEKESALAQMQSLQNELKSTHINYAVKASLGKYSFIEGLTSEQVALLMHSEIQKELAQRKAVLHHENGFLNLKSAENPETDYYDNDKGKVLGYSELLDTIVANSKLQKVNDGQVQNTGVNAQSFGNNIGNNLTHFQRQVMGLQ